MAPRRQQRPDAWQPNAHAIDLTLDSSPEPEQRNSMPSRQPHRQSQLKWEGQSSTIPRMVVGSKVIPHASQVSAMEAPSRPIHPEHLRNIIDTSDSTALRQVLFNLCQWSPALSGAVARGLAPHSTFAKQLKDRNRNASSAHRTASRPVASIAPVSNTAVKLEKPGLMSNSKFKQEQSPTPIRNQSQTSTAYDGRHVAPRATIKQENAPNSHHTTADDELRRPQSVMRSAQRVSSSQSANRHQHGGPATLSSGRAKPSSSFQKNMPAKIKQEANNRSKSMMKTCVRCDNLFRDDEDDFCMYHPGEFGKQEDGILLWSCCLDSQECAGCEFAGLHTDDAEDLTEEEDFPTRKRPSPAPHSSGVDHKRRKNS
ncbi:hypothetical protein ACN47E_006933 [Coniothyrium glycines]